MTIDKSIADFQDGFSEDLTVLKGELLRCELFAQTLLKHAKKIQPAYKSWDEPTFSNGTVSLFTTQRQLMLLLDKLQAINASFVYGDLAQLVEESGSDYIAF